MCRNLEFLLCCHSSKSLKNTTILLVDLKVNFSMRKPRLKLNVDSFKTWLKAVPALPPPAIGRKFINNKIFLPSDFFFS